MRVWLLLGLVLLVGSAQALESGERLAPWTLNDQFDRSYTLDDQLHILLVARSMDGAKLVKAALEGRPKGYLEARRAQFVADISRMPGLIGKLFAIPAMRDYRYRVLLDREAQVVPQYAAPEEGVLWLQLEQGVLRERRLFTDAAALRAALEQVAP
ncbi:FAD/FMN-containing dehydrogenase [Pseudomonas sp. GCM10022188]|uniref:FAD/FMN-containing dehydrogenase n=1 Tax=Pseudomonas TaxID=286 RepID=UPI001E5E7D18|nr:FAD/FMN-containing dehydrogenase [Pseudomonas oryzagri]MCC6075974.1 FAD/FMN-containing dehydrogenase [Pseudomonas oryzagri]